MTVLEQIAAWVHAGISDAAFADWLWVNYDQVEEALGVELAMEIASLDFSQIERDTRAMRARLARQLSIPPPRVLCLCAAMGERSRCMESSDFFAYRDEKLSEMKSHYPGYGAAFLFACRVCAQRWCMFGDDDDCYFLRLTHQEGTAILERNDWPRIFLDWEKQNRDLNPARPHYPGAETFRATYLSLELVSPRPLE